MSNRTNLDELVLLSDDEFRGRIQAARARVETRVQRCQDEGRDMSDRESQLSHQDRDELVALKDATRFGRPATGRPSR